MKELKKVFIIEFIVFWVLYVLLTWLIYSIVGKSMVFSITILGLFFAAFFAGINMLTIYSFLKPKLNFLESKDAQVPAFGNKLERTYMVERNDFSFEVIKYKIKEQYDIVLYDDVEQYIIKFHSGISPFSWGVGGVVVYDSVAKEVLLTCFPMSGYTEKAAKLTQNVVDKVENMIVNK